MNRFHYIGLDPGGETGYCIYDPFTREVSTSILTADEHHNRLYTNLVVHRPKKIICERFDHRPNQKAAELVSREYIGVAKLYTQTHYGVELVMQQQLKGHKGLWTDDKLKVLGLYNPGEGHDNDALRQVLYYITVEENDLYWVRKYQELASEDEAPY